MKKRLVRSEENKEFLGVAAGIADYFGIDPGLVRAGIVLGSIFTFPAVPIAYGVMGLVMSPPDTPAGQLVTDGLGKAQELFGKAADRVGTQTDKADIEYVDADDIKKSMKIEKDDDGFLV